MVLQRLSGQKLTKSENNDDVTSLRLDGCSFSGLENKIVYSFNLLLTDRKFPLLKLSFWIRYPAVSEKLKRWTLTTKNTRDSIQKL